MTVEKNKLIGVADIINILGAGADFYSDVIDDTEDRNTKRIFIRMIKVRELAIDELNVLVIEEKNQVKKESLLSINIKRLYKNLLGQLYFDKKHTYMTQLKNVEDKTLLALEQAIAQGNSQLYLEHLSKIKTAMLRCQNDMKVLKFLAAQTM